MSSTNKTTHYELSQYIGTDKPTYLGDYNSDMLAIDKAIHNAADNASTAVSTANSAASTASDAATAASAATTTSNNAASTANLAKTTAETASTNASAALTAAQGAQTAAAANTITNLAPAYDPTLTYAVGDLVTYVDDQGSGKLYKCIVDIASPEAFNINKWDDVTTSEVYANKRRVVGHVKSDGLLTFGQLLSALKEYIDDINAEYLVICHTSSYTTYFHESGHSNVSIQMHSNKSTANGFVIETISVSQGTPVFDRYTITYSAGTPNTLVPTYTNVGNETATTDVSFDLIKL